MVDGYPHTSSGIASRLAAPSFECALADLPDAWFCQAVEVTCRGLGAAAADPQTLTALRGRWGRRLMDAASEDAIAGRPCPWVPPCTLDIFFREQGKAAPGVPIPKPYGLCVEPIGRDLQARVTVHGFACDWSDAVSDSWTAALRDVLLRRPRERAGHRHSIPPDAAIVQRVVRTIERVPSARIEEMAALRFLTPLHERGEASIVERPASFLMGLANRVSAMARWHDTRIVADWGGLKSAAEDVHCAFSNVREVRWERRSTRQQGRRVPMRGIMGDVWLAGGIAPFLPILELGQTTNAGSHASQGLGAYALMLDASDTGLL